MKKFQNSQKKSFLDGFPDASVDLDDDKLALKCKFNLAYFDCHSAGQTFEDWTKDQLSTLLHKLKEFSKQPLKYWEEQGILVIYGSFPPKAKTKFSLPKHVPHQAKWGRFRLGNKVRLAGFVLPPEYHQKMHNGTKHFFDCNTFYIVFLDANHHFYLTEAD